jgi:subtilase family serine protease
VVPKAQATAPGNRPGLVRSEPDIAAAADRYTGFATGLLTFPKNKRPKFIKIPVGGTSMSAPLVAGIVADAQQGQHKAFGFTNPVLYRLNGTRALHDILPSASRTPALFRGRGVQCPVLRCPVADHLR